MASRLSPDRSPWFWVPSLFFTQGLPYTIATIVSVVMYKRLGISNADITLYTGWLFLPWGLRAIWSPIIEYFHTKRFWIVWMELCLGVCMALVAFSIPGPYFFQLSLAFFWLLGFSSSLHDMSTDSLYMMSLTTREQAYFAGFRNVFYRLAVISAQGLLVIVAGNLENYLQDIPRAWCMCMGLVAVVFLCSFVWHKVFLPQPEMDLLQEPVSSLSWDKLLRPFRAYFQRDQIGLLMLFLLFYRVGETQLVKMIPPFLLDNASLGGMGMETSRVGVNYGTVGMIAMIVGGYLGGVIINWKGLRTSLWLMFFSMNVPNLAYAVIAAYPPQEIAWVNLVIFIEQFGFGMAFTVFLMILIVTVKGEYQTSHFALSTGFMTLGMIFPSMISGWVQEQLGYVWFFTYACICSLPCLWITYKMGFHPDILRTEFSPERSN
ncbi:MAG: MFS transporter [Bacteroidota bacterium]